MKDFSQEIQNFQRYGTYEYKFDSVGNLTFNSSSNDFSQVFLAFPLQNVIYNNNKIKTFFNVNFEEFVPTETSSSVDANNLEEQLQSVQQENDSLKNQLDQLVSQAESNSSAADQLAVKQVILELRKALGQGRVESDFSDSFPYTPIIKNKN